MANESRSGMAPAPGARSDLLFLAGLFLVLLLASWLRPLTVPDEGRYADVARWMVVHHDWLIPRLDGLPFFHKPPLLYWIDASLFSLFGISPQVARIAPVLAATLCCAGLLWFLRRHTSVALARLAVAILASGVLFFGGSQYVNHDLLVATWISLAILFFADAALTESRTGIFLGYLACGLGFISKGLIGIALPGLVLLPWLLATRRWGRIPRLLNPFGILLMVAVILPWFLLVEQRFPGFMHYFFIDQEVNRYLAGTFNNKQPWWFYLACLLVGFLPWWFLLPGRAWQRARELLGGDIAGLMLWWVLSILVFFSIPLSKLAGYIFPVTPALAALMAAATLRSSPGGLRRAAAPLFLLMVAAALLVAAALRVGDISAAESHSLMLVTATAMVVAIVLLLRSRLKDWQLTTTLAAAAWSLLVALTIGIADHKNDSHDLAVRQYLTPGTQLVFYRRYYYDLPFLLNLPDAVPVVEEWEQVKTDSWALELKDGTRFDAVAAQKLWTEDKLNQEIQAGHRLLLLMPTSYGMHGLEHLQPVFEGYNFKAYLIGA